MPTFTLRIAFFWPGLIVSSFPDGRSVRRSPRSSRYMYIRISIRFSRSLFCKHQSPPARPRAAYTSRPNIYLSALCAGYQQRTAVQATESAHCRGLGVSDIDGPHADSPRGRRARGAIRKRHCERLCKCASFLGVHVHVKLPNNSGTEESRPSGKLLELYGALGANMTHVATSSTEICEICMRAHVLTATVSRDMPP